MISVPSLLLVQIPSNDSVFSLRVLDVELPLIAYSQTTDIMPDAKKAGFKGKCDHVFSGVSSGLMSENHQRGGRSHSGPNGQGHQESL